MNAAFPRRYAKKGKLRHPSSKERRALRLAAGWAACPGCATGLVKPGNERCGACLTKIGALLKAARKEAAAELRRGIRRRPC